MASAVNILSMTGFGRAAMQAGGVTVEVEIKSVNHRFLDLNVKLPRLYNRFEAEVRELLVASIPRGRVEIFVSRISRGAGAASLVFNRPLFEEITKIYEQMLGGRRALGPEARRAVAMQVLAQRQVLDVLEESALDPREGRTVITAVRKALGELEKMRRREGAELGTDLTKRLRQVEQLRTQMAKRFERKPAELRDRLIARVQKLAPEIQVDPSRLAAEAAILADRIDTTEELVRLESHLKQFHESLRAPSQGRKLDFIVQEMGRELNTIASKAQDADVQGLVIDAKAEIERLKEQIQNIQ